MVMFIISASFCGFGSKANARGVGNTALAFHALAFHALGTTMLDSEAIQPPARSLTCILWQNEGKRGIISVSCFILFTRGALICYCL